VDSVHLQALQFLHEKAKHCTRGLAFWMLSSFDSLTFFSAEPKYPLLQTVVAQHLKIDFHWSDYIVKPWSLVCLSRDPVPCAVNGHCFASWKWALQEPEIHLTACFQVVAMERNQRKLNGAQQWSGVVY